MWCIREIWDEKIRYRGEEGLCSGVSREMGRKGGTYPDDRVGVLPLRQPRISKTCSHAACRGEALEAGYSRGGVVRRVDVEDGDVHEGMRDKGHLVGSRGAKGR